MLGLLLGCYVEVGPPDSIRDAPFRDYDGDGYALAQDCDDEDPAAFPGAPETLNDVDDDCDGTVDEGWDTGCVEQTWYLDQDQDGWGDSAQAFVDCETPQFAVGRDGDCDDTRPDVNPDVLEVCGDALDQDCVPGNCGLWATGLGDAAASVSDSDARLGYATLMADVDADGVQDLVAGAPGDGGGTVRVWSSPDLSGLGAPVVLQPNDGGGFFGGSLAYGDIDGQPGGEVVVGAYGWQEGKGAVYIDGKVVVNRSQASGIFGRSLAIGDFDDDGQQDLVVGADAYDTTFTDAGAAYIFTGPVTGAGPTRAHEGAASYAFAGYDVLAHDLTGDGVPEAIVGEPGWHTPALSTGSGGFVRVLQSGGGVTNLNRSATPDGLGRALAAGDVNGDGQDELIATALVAGQVVVFETSQWTTTDAIDVPPATAEHLASVASCDFDGDGVADVVVSHSDGGGGLWVAHGPITGTVAPDVGFAGTADRPLGASVVCGDVDGDGFDDGWLGTHYIGAQGSGAYLLLGGRD